ncbi:MAG: DUF2799 domain-containing protein [Alishewanella sp.]|nr:DUF2799 domain-containing protein [Alishewanella sp.]
MNNNKWPLLLLSMIISGCSGMNKSQCITADWRTIGFEDGVNGKAENAIATYRQECAEHGVTPQLEAYRLGHREGSERYCTTRNGFIVGKRGSNYQNSCMPDLEKGFLLGYRDGKTLFELQRALNSARSNIDKQRRVIANLEQEIVDKTELLIADGLTRDDRVQLLNEIELHKYEINEALNALPELEAQAYSAEQAYNQAEQRFKSYL